jgi:hypothetical protein
MPGINLNIEPSELQPLIAEVVKATIAALDAERAQPNAWLAYTKVEAAAMIGQQPYQLREERRKGRIEAGGGTARRTLNARGALLAYLAVRRWTPEPNGQNGTARSGRPKSGFPA